MSAGPRGRDGVPERPSCKYPASVKRPLVSNRLVCACCNMRNLRNHRWLPSFHVPAFAAYIRLAQPSLTRLLQFLSRSSSYSAVAIKSVVPIRTELFMDPLSETQPNRIHENAVISRPNPTQPSSWMDPTQVQLRCRLFRGLRIGIHVHRVRFASITKLQFGRRLRD